jgi:hypothetical protein
VAAVDHPAAAAAAAAVAAAAAARPADHRAAAAAVRPPRYPEMAVLLAVSSSARIRRAACRLDRAHGLVAVGGGA